MTCFKVPLVSFHADMTFACLFHWQPFSLLPVTSTVLFLCPCLHSLISLSLDAVKELSTGRASIQIDLVSMLILDLGAVPDAVDHLRARGCNPVGSALCPSLGILVLSL